MRNIISFLLSLVLVLFVPINNTYAETTKDIIFVGDSRTVGMDKIVKFSDNENFYKVAEVGKGYDWLISEALPKIDKIETQSVDCTEVYLLGVNDLGNIDKYTEWFKERSIDHNIVVVSVNPVEDCKTVSNYSISNFNAKLAESGVNYIDTNTVMQDIPYKKTTDGLHYNRKTYQYLYKILLTSLCEYV